MYWEVRLFFAIPLEIHPTMRKLCLAFHQLRMKMIEVQLFKRTKRPSSSSWNESWKK